MKKLLFSIAVVMGITACVNEDPKWTNPTVDGDEVGYINFSQGGLTVDTSDESASGEVSPAAMGTRADINVDDYTIAIYNTSGELACDTFTYSERESKYTTSTFDSSRKGIALAKGVYTVMAYSAETPAVANAPQYSGKTSVTVTKEAVSAASITCRLSSVKVSVRFDSILANLITDDTQARVELGTTSINKYTFTGKNTTFGDATYLRPDDTTNPLYVYLTTVYNGSQITNQALKICDNAKAGEWRKVTIKLENGENGTIIISITVSTWIEGNEIDVDVTTTTVSMTEATIPDDSDAPEIIWTDHDYTAPFTITDAMFNTSGAFTEGAAFTVSTKAAISSFQLSATSTNSDLTSALAEIGLNDAGIDLTQPTSSTVKIILGGWGFPTTDIAGATALSFDLSGLMKALHDTYSGTHAFTMTIADANGSSSTATLNLTSGIVIDPNIVWAGHDMEQRYIVDDDLTMQITVTASTGIKSLVVNITGELAPGLTAVEMPSTFDLVSPGQKLDGGDLGTSLVGLGFPIGDDVKDKTSISFDITPFKTLLKSFKGDTDFGLTVTDNEGNSISRAVKITIQ